MDQTDGELVAASPCHVWEVEHGVTARAQSQCFYELLKARLDEPETEYAMVDATILKVDRYGKGAEGGLKVRHWLR